VINVSNLTKYYGDYAAIRDVTFEVPKGKIVGFLGPNGAGKTTTLRILAGYLTATSGRATIDGRIKRLPCIRAPTRKNVPIRDQQRRAVGAKDNKSRCRAEACVANPRLKEQRLEGRLVHQNHVVSSLV